MRQAPPDTPRSQQLHPNQLLQLQVNRLLLTIIPVACLCALLTGRVSPLGAVLIGLAVVARDCFRLRCSECGSRALRFEGATPDRRRCRYRCPACGSRCSWPIGDDHDDGRC